MARLLARNDTDSDDTYRSYISLLANKIWKDTNFEPNLPSMTMVRPRTSIASIQDLCDPNTEHVPLRQPLPSLTFRHELIRAGIHANKLSIVDGYSASADIQAFWRDHPVTFLEICIAGAEADNPLALATVLKNLEVPPVDRWRLFYVSYASHHGDDEMFRKIMFPVRLETEYESHPSLAKLFAKVDIVEVLQWRTYNDPIQTETSFWDRQYCFPEDEGPAMDILMHTPSVYIIEILKEIREHSHFPQTTQEIWVNILHVAVENSWQDMILHLLKLGAHRSCPYMKTALKRACRRQCVRTVRLLLQYGAIADDETLEIAVDSLNFDLVWTFKINDEYVYPWRRDLALSAVDSERHDALLQTFAQQGFCDKDHWQVCLEWSQERGSESTANLLKRTHPWHSISQQGVHSIQPCDKALGKGSQSAKKGHRSASPSPEEPSLRLSLRPDALLKRIHFN